MIELSADDPSFRPVRLLLKKYDKGTSEGAAGGDNRLSPGEFGIDPKEFASADTDGDGALDTEELRRFLGRVEPDLELSSSSPASGSAATTIAASGRGLQALAAARSAFETLSDGDLEVAIGELSLEFHADGGEHAAENAKSYYAGQFQAADTDNNKYLEKSEVKDHGPFAALFDTMDRDGDGKLYMKEVDAFVDQQTQAARSQMVLSVADQGRAIFAIVDLNRDRHLGVREIRGRGCAGLVVGPQRRRPDPLRRDPPPLPVVDRPGPDHRRRHVRVRRRQDDGVARRAAGRRRPIVVPQDGSQPRRRHLPPRVPRPPRRVRATRPRPRRPDRRRGGRQGEEMTVPSARTESSANVNIRAAAHVESRRDAGWRAIVQTRNASRSPTRQSTESHRTTELPRKYTYTVSPHDSSSHENPRANSAESSSVIWSSS